jgi:thymidylate synthase ThyX
MPSWVSVHFARHKWEKFISTQRDDRKEHEISRADMPQGTPVDFDGFANMQNLIDSWRKRLCFQASPETRAYAEDFKVVLNEVYPELAGVLVPNCLYRCGCPEMEMCKQRYFEQFMKEAYGRIDNLTDIQYRYDIYNEWFYKTHPFKED